MFLPDTLLLIGFDYVDDTACFIWKKYCQNIFNIYNEDIKNSFLYKFYDIKNIFRKEKLNILFKKNEMPLIFANAEFQSNLIWY